MKDLKYYDISLRQLYIFYEAAKFESFTKAADHLFITQPIVSKSIAALEDELGFSLFTRAPRKVTLTSAGKILLASCVKIFSIMEESISHAESELQSGVKCLKIGIDKTTDPNTYLYPILRKFSSLFPDIQVELELIDPLPGIESVTNGVIDISFIMLCNIQNLDGLLLDWRIIKSCPHIAYVPKRLLPPGDYKTEDILQLPLIITTPQANINYYNKTMSIYYEYGIKPNIRSHVFSNTTMLFNLHQGEGMVITNEFMDTGSDQDIVPVPLSGTKDGLVVFWRKEEQNPLLQDFVNVSEKVLN